MKKCFCLAVIFAFMSSKGFAQEKKYEFGHIVYSDFETGAPDFDEDAEAVVLYDEGITTFVDRDRGLEIKYVRTTRIKILTEAGMDWSEVSIPLYMKDIDDVETIMNLAASSYNLVDGKIEITELSRKNVYEETINEHWYVKKFAMPAVKEGTIIEYQYTIFSPFIFNLPDWKFQNRIPTIYSKYEVSITPFYQYTFILQGATHFSEQSSVEEYWNKKKYAGIEYHEMIHTFGMKNIPAFRDESYITSVEDYIVKIDFQLSKIIYTHGGSKDFMSTWEEINREYIKSENFGDYIKKSQKIASKLFETELPIAHLSDEEKNKTIVDYVKKKISWNGYNRTRVENTPKKVLVNAKGSSAEINLFLVGMLKAAGLNAKPVLISTRKHGKVIMQYPYVHFFNYVIAVVETDGHYVVTDATEPLLAFNRIPARCINSEGLIVEMNSVNWLDLNTSVYVPSIIRNTMFLKIDSVNNVINVEVQEQSTEYQSLARKKDISANPQSFTNKLLEQGFENVTEFETKYLQEPGKALIIKFKADYPLEYFDNKLIISPLLSFPLTENQLKQKERKYPVDLNYKKEFAYTSALELPPGYEVVSLPEKYHVDNSLITIELKSEEMSGKILTIGVVKLKKAIYPPEDYQGLKKYFDIIIKRFNEKIILEEIQDKTSN